MGRSGTSLVAAALGELGVELGPRETMVEARPVHNLHGYWEQAAILALDDALLAERGASWSNPPAEDPGWERRPELAPLYEQARDLLKTLFGDTSLWGFKDSRASFTFPFWQQLAPSLKAVICIRNPLEVAASFGRFEPEVTPAEGWLGLWLRTTAASLVATAGCNRLVIDYREWGTDAEATLARLAEFVKLPVSGTTNDENRELFDPQLRHHRIGLDELLADHAVPADVQALYAALTLAPTNLDTATLLARRLVEERNIANAARTSAAALAEHWEAESARHQAAAEAATEELRRVTEWFTALEASASWRLTSPLRALKRRVSRP